MPDFHSIPWLSTAANLIGIEENKDETKLLVWAKVIGGTVAREYTASSIPWCGLFVAYCMVENGVQPPATPLWALSWAEWGTKLDEPAFGCVMAFKRQGGGHVGFYVGEDSDYYFILGGNQNDMVNVTRVAKNRLAGVTWPSGQEQLYAAGRVYTDFAEAKVSVNEA